MNLEIHLYYRYEVLIRQNFVPFISNILLCINARHKTYFKSEFPYGIERVNLIKIRLQQINI